MAPFLLGKKIRQPSSYMGFNRHHTWGTTVIIHGVQPSSYMGYNRDHTWGTTVIIHGVQPSSYMGDDRRIFLSQEEWGQFL